jgi:hypothetical protein
MTIMHVHAHTRHHHSSTNNQQPSIPNTWMNKMK